MTTQQISEQVRQLILEGDLDDAANALVQFFDKEWMSRGDKEQVQLYNQDIKNKISPDRRCISSKFRRGNIPVGCGRYNWRLRVRRVWSKPPLLTINH